MTTTHRITAALMAFFEGEGWGYTADEEHSLLKLGFTGKNGNWSCIAQVREAVEQFVFYSICPLTIPEKKRLAIAEFLTRANYGLIIGNFEMDLEDGEIRFKSSVDAESGELTYPMIKNTVYPSVLLMDKYLPGILAVLAGNVAPKVALDEIEAEDQTDLSKM